MAVIEGARPRALVKAGALSSGDFNGVANKGDLACDSVNGKVYINTGTLASTTWTVVGTQT